MHDTDLVVPARYYARLAPLLLTYGVSLDAVLHDLGLSPEALRQPDAMISFAQVDRLVQAVVARTGRADLAVNLGHVLSASSHSFVGFGMVNCQTLDQALRFEAQYFRLVMPSFRMRYRSGPDAGQILITPVVAMSHVCLAFHLETIAMAALRELSDLTAGQRPPCRLQLSIPEPPHVACYAALGDVQVQFAALEQPGVAVQIRTDPRAVALTMADANARQVAEARCRALVQRTTASHTFADWVEMMLREAPEALPSLGELAASLNISQRTLNRYLGKEGKSYRALAGRVQHELACARLAAGNRPVTEVAYSLGFADTSNFARAFRARAGCSPSAYQRQHAAYLDPTIIR
jgi:AraC-like DNA-binding protein